MQCVLRLSPHPTFRRCFCRCSAPDISQYREAFGRRMTIAGIKPHHRIALGVSGGPDSMALCVLTAGWKLSGFNGKTESSGFIEGLVAIIVDHRLRAESTEEAILVRDRVNKMGIMCQIENCDWSHGRPKHGHVQEAAREMRYQIFQDVCVKQHIGVLLIAHHADDQVELLILRLSRNSGVLGLSCMAFISQLFPLPLGGSENSDGILLVRPMLEFNKDDMYNICQGANQDWVEDPTNQSPLYTRNRIRASLRSFSSDHFQLESHRLISACRLVRAYVETVCLKMIKDSVTIMELGYAVIDLVKLMPSCIDDLCLSRYAAWILQFISQRHRPIRGHTSQMLLDYIRNFPCKTSLTVAGCYLSPAPQSKGTKLLICCSVDSLQSSKMGLSLMYSSGDRSLLHNEIHQIIADAKSYSDQFFLEASDVSLMHANSSVSVLTEARRRNLISDSTLKFISLLQAEENEKFSSKGVESDPDLRHKVKCAGAPSISILPGQTCFFMNRFLVTWRIHGHVEGDGYSLEGIQDQSCQICRVEPDMTFQVRCMVEADWLFLGNILKNQVSKDVGAYADTSINGLIKTAEKKMEHFRFIHWSAQSALKVLKSIPLPARKGLPVLVTSEGLLVSIPSIGFSVCPLLEAVSVFKPKVPLGGGYSSYI
ncbi:tRNA(Ile)-lysidine synthase-like isoform X2 [Zingiber officinale]|uniref:tRNA(Ile)-lysidine synthase-like isoform X2 n=1 Tax=Zingiber officinale TaxID=94328 RepID=UPI001C4CDFB0|nr:tRNA(Ile)-lysidine synthase-like isoform X2 [Zingiber officinale]XP_042408236.1 tRNA(Ile)-lysidine synthase-like isoform X2 [Zingiber officinale]